MRSTQASIASIASGARACSIANTAAPTMPARTPDDDATMRKSAVASGSGSGSERWYTTSRTPASSGSPASASDPPMTMMLGLSRLTALAYTSPMVRPASRMRPIASVDPARRVGAQPNVGQGRPGLTSRTRRGAAVAIADLRQLDDRHPGR
jgi:hypothetical protein